MRHLAACFVLCFVASCLIPSGSVARADEKDKSPAAEAKSTKKEAKQKDPKPDAKDAKPDAKPAKDEAKTKKDKDAKKAPDKKKTKKETPKKKPAPPEKKPIHEMKKGPFKVTVDLKGLFEARRTAEVILWPDQWSGFTVLKAAEHGKQVKQGDLLIAFDPEKIDRAIDDLRRQLKLTDIDMRSLKQQLAALEKLAPMDLAAVDRRQRIAKEDFEQLMKVGLPMSKEMAKFSLKRMEEYLAYAKEELAQLEKMYKADDLTEETEEIILRRARFQVASAEMSCKMYKQRYDEQIKFSFPRSEESAKESIKRNTLSNKQAKILLPLALKKTRLGLEKADVARQRLEKKLKELLADRKLMTIKSPADGILYYGECVDGRWTGSTSPKQFKRGASLPTKKVIMTVVKTRPILIRSTTTEKDIRLVQEGLKGKAKPTAYPDARLEVVVAEVAAVPNAKNCFATKLMVTNPDAAAVMPGMTCTVKLIAYKKDKALSIPPTALGTDPDDDTKYFVHLLGKDGKSKKRKVKVGHRTAKAVEIVGGLSVGDKILKICPKDDGKDDKKETKNKKK